MGDHVPVIDLSLARGAREAWNRSRFVVYLWGIFELLFVANPWQVSSSLRKQVLVMFGAEIGENVILRPRLRVRFPWNLKIGDSVWIGEGVWFHNQAEIIVGSNVVISQESMLTTGSHDLRRDMSLLTRKIVVHDGVWITSRCMVLGGTVLGQSSVIAPMSLVAGSIVPENEVWRGNPAIRVGNRF